MDRRKQVILVTGATGHQGGASSRSLLKDGWRVRALVRDTNKPAAVELELIGAELVAGDLLDRVSLDAAVRGCYGVHSVQTFREAGAEGEEQEGRNIADAAAAAGVEHFVYDSVIGADRESGMPWVVTKHHLETYIRGLGLPFTVLRPVTFMENFLGVKDDILAGRLPSVVPASEVHQYLAVRDIGRFVALAFAGRDRFLGREMEIASDELTPLQIAQIFSEVLGRPVAYEPTEPPAGMPPPTPDETGEPPRRADLGMLRQLIPDLLTFDDWVRSTAWAPTDTSVSAAPSPAGRR